MKLLEQSLQDLFYVQHVEYERSIVDHERGGYLEGYYDDCEECGGFGEVEIDPDRDCIVDEYGNLYWKDEPKF